MTAVLEAAGAGYEARVPASFTASIVLHAGGLLLWMQLAQHVQSVQTQVISNVDILVAQPQAQAQAALPRAKAPPSMRDFLKMALPSVQKSRGPMQIQAPEARRQAIELPQERLTDRGHLKDVSKMSTIKLDARRADLAQVAQEAAPTRQAHAMAALPRLEEVGTRRAPAKVLQMAALDDEADRSARPQGLPTLAVPDTGRRQAPPQAAILPEASAAASGPKLSRLADMLTSEKTGLQQEARPMAIKSSALETSTPAPAPPRAKAQTVSRSGKNSVEIEGPLSHRKVLSSSVPAFPQWAKDQNILEAEVAIRFNVDPAGSVLEEMRVERSSGYGRLDRMVMDHLKTWRFAPAVSDAGNQWGVITFRFVLE